MASSGDAKKICVAILYCQITSAIRRVFLFIEKHDAEGNNIPATCAEVLGGFLSGIGLAGLLDSHVSEMIHNTVCYAIQS